MRLLKTEIIKVGKYRFFRVIPEIEIPKLDMIFIVSGNLDSGLIGYSYYSKNLLYI
jgi:hypothetical protein